MYTNKKMFTENSLSTPLLLRFVIIAVLLFSISISCTGSSGWGESEWDSASGPLVKREERKSVVSTEYGEISAVRVADDINGSYLLHFFTLEPNALFLPVVLHADMVLYVHTGSGKMSWTEEDELKRSDLRRGDVYRLQQGAVFFVQSNLETESERQKLRIHAIFANSKTDPHEPVTGPYSSVRDMVLGFDRKVLQAAFKVPEEVIDELLSGARQAPIIHSVSGTKRNVWDLETRFIRDVLGSRSYSVFELNKKRKKESTKLYNLFKEDKDFENCNGWSTTVTRKKLSALRDSNIGLFMVNLTIGSMMGPHWNPMATEIAVVLQGRGMVRVVCSDVSNRTTCKNMRFVVQEGDVFAVPRFHPMAQMAFNNDTFVFMGFSTSAKKNHPQYLAGQASVLRTLDKDVLAMSFAVENATLDQLLAPQSDSVILGCTSCAEEEWRTMQEEIQREREEAREREEEEARKREEEKRREEEEARKREEEARKREEEAARREEEERRKREEEEEAARKREEEERQRQEEEERQRKEEEAAARREEEERRKREEEEEAARKREEEEKRRREEQEASRREEEERQRREEQEAARREEEERQREEEAARREAEKRQRREEEKAARREQEERQREEEAARREEEERQRRAEEEAERREEEEAAGREEERQRQAEEEAARQREGEEAARGEAEEGQRQEEEEAAEQREEEDEGGARPAEEERQGGRSEEERAAEEEQRMDEEARREEEAARQQERERQQEEEQGGGGSREEAGETWVEHENHGGSHEEWRRRIPKKRLTV